LAGAFDQDAAGADPQRKSKAFNSAKVGAHHAIIPTANVPELNALSEPERNLYDLIARSYLAQFYPPEQYRSTYVLFQADSYRFASNGRVDVSAGWRSLYRQGQGGGEEQADAEPVDLERLTAGEQGSVSDAGAKREFTKPPTRYAMKTLLKDLAQVAKYVTDPKIRELLISKDADKADEAGGIGTPATRDTHIETLFQRGFLAEKGGKVLSTEMGRSFHDALPPFAVKPDMTALWHEKQRLIECGDLDYQSLLADIDEVVSSEIGRVRRDGLPISVNGSIQCPACQEGALRRIKGKKGFLGDVVGTYLGGIERLALALRIGIGGILAEDSGQRRQEFHRRPMTLVVQIAAVASVVGNRLVAVTQALSDLKHLLRLVVPQTGSVGLQGQQVVRQRSGKRAILGLDGEKARILALNGIYDAFGKSAVDHPALLVQRSIGTGLVETPQGHCGPRSG